MEGKKGGSEEKNTHGNGGWGATKGGRDVLASKVGRGGNGVSSRQTKKSAVGVGLLRARARVHSGPGPTVFRRPQTQVPARARAPASRPGARPPLKNTVSARPGARKNTLTVQKSETLWWPSDVPWADRWVAFGSDERGRGSIKTVGVGTLTLSLAQTSFSFSRRSLFYFSLGSRSLFRADVGVVEEKKI